MARARGSVDLYELLAELAAAELELVRAGEFATLGQLHEERRTLVSRLPSQAPAAALEPLTRAAELLKQTSEAIAAALEVARQELGRLDRGRGAVQAYTPSITHVAAADVVG
jgi:hypothetical protein